MQNHIGKLEMIKWYGFDNYFKINELFSPAGLASQALFADLTGYACPTTTTGTLKRPQGVSPTSHNALDLYLT